MGVLWFFCMFLMLSDDMKSEIMKSDMKNEIMMNDFLLVENIEDDVVLDDESVVERDARM